MAVKKSGKGCRKLGHEKMVVKLSEKSWSQDGRKMAVTESEKSWRQDRGKIGVTKLKVKTD